jgi:hypothetical protein
MGDLAARRPVNKIAIRTMNQPGHDGGGGIWVQIDFYPQGGRNCAPMKLSSGRIRAPMKEESYVGMIENARDGMEIMGGSAGSNPKQRGTKTMASEATGRKMSSVGRRRWRVRPLAERCRAIKSK